jgi:hypothetical protein
VGRVDEGLIFFEESFGRGMRGVRHEGGIPEEEGFLFLEGVIDEI